MNDVLSDPLTYNSIRKDPTKIITRDLRDLLTRWKKENYISESTAKSLFTSDAIYLESMDYQRFTNPITLYALLFPLLTNVLYILLFSLTSFFHKILNEYLPCPTSYISNSYELVSRFNNLHLENHFKLFSLDMLSLMCHFILS